MDRYFPWCPLTFLCSSTLVSFLFFSTCVPHPCTQSPAQGLCSWFYHNVRSQHRGHPFHSFPAYIGAPRVRERYLVPAPEQNSFHVHCLLVCSLYNPLEHKLAEGFICHLCVSILSMYSSACLALHRLWVASSFQMNVGFQFPKHSMHQR